MKDHCHAYNFYSISLSLQASQNTSDEKEQAVIGPAELLYQGSHRLLITGFKVFSRIFKVNNNNSQEYVFKARPPLPPLLAIRSSHKILYCHMILT